MLEALCAINQVIATQFIKTTNALVILSQHQRRNITRIFVNHERLINPEFPLGREALSR
jgi:hypothetical protein